MTSRQIQSVRHAAPAPVLRAALLRLALLLPLAPVPCVAADNIVVHAQRQGAAVAIEARALLAAPLPVIWATLTDYDRLSEFIPGMRSSRVIERRGAVSVVRQFGEAGLLLFRLPVDVVVEALEIAPHVIEIRVLSGNLRKLDGRYQIEPDTQTPGHFVLRWFGVIEPQEQLPPLVGVPILRANIGEQFRGMVREIERRARLLPDVNIK